MLADAGYDVWMANARGTPYSQHISLSPKSERFWDFSMDEIAQNDLPATIDYILANTGQSQLHYVAYSQGTTTFMMLLSQQPSYNHRIMTSHLMGPGVYLCNMRSQLAVIGTQVIFQPFISSLITRKSMSTHPLFKLVRAISPTVCKWTPSVCVMVMHWITGWGSPYLNTVSSTILSSLLKADI